MRLNSLLWTIFSSILISPMAYPLGLELEFGANLGKEKLEPRTKTTSTETDSQSAANSAVEELTNPLIFGGRFDGRLLFVHNSSMNLSAGAGLGWEKASSSASVNGAKLEFTYNRFMLEPNAKLTYFPSRDFALTAGLGYSIGLSGSATTSVNANTLSQETKADLKEDSALRLRLGGAFTLSGAHRPQIQIGYQLTAAGSIKPEGASEKDDLSGHSLIVSYVHPIIFGGADMNMGNDSMERPQKQRSSAPMNDKNQRRRKQRQRTEQ